MISVVNQITIYIKEAAAVILTRSNVYVDGTTALKWQKKNLKTVAHNASEVFGQHTAPPVQ